MRPRVDGARLRELRDEEWFTQGELAEMAGIELHTISRIENGETIHPRRGTLLALAEALGVEWKELVMNGDGTSAAPLEDSGSDLVEPLSIVRGLFSGAQENLGAAESYLAPLAFTLGAA